MFQKLENVFREVFDDDTLDVTDSLSLQTYAAWDSFAQVKLIISLSDEFGVQFTTEEVLKASSVGAIRELLRAKGIAEE